jgi:hypothetical protein
LSLTASTWPGIYAYGGFSSDRHELATRMLGRAPSAAELALFDNSVQRAGAKLGSDWIDEAAVQRVVKRMQPHIERLREIKRLQNEAKTAKATTPS